MFYIMIRRHVMDYIKLVGKYGGIWCYLHWALFGCYPRPCAAALKNCAKFNKFKDF